MAAAVGDFSKEKENALYLQPYQQPFAGIPFPALEMLGPFVGHAVTQPRLRSHDYHQAAEALWTAMEELLRGEEEEPVDPISLSVPDQTDEL